MEFFPDCEWVWDWGDPCVIYGKFWNEPQLDNVEVVSNGKSQMDPTWEIWTEVWSEIFGWILARVSGRKFACKM